MELSYWEYKTWLSNIDFTVVGSGIVGLNCAIGLKRRFPKAKVLVLEKGLLPQGASTKNAGFACFGSISEILSDLNNHSEQEVFDLVEKRFKGIQMLRNLLGDNAIDFQILGGHELFLDSQKLLFETCSSELHEINKLLEPIFGAKPFERTPNQFGFQNIDENAITHKFEGQIDTGKLMQSLLAMARQLGVFILNGIEIRKFEDLKENVQITTDKFEFKSGKLFIATNGFAKQLLNEDVRPARAQVLITKPIENLPFEGTFHLSEGYYYFRNIDGRILLGGGRNLDFKAEETILFGQTKIVQDYLEKLLHEVILPGVKVEIENRWSGIMGIGNQKNPILRQLSNYVFCGVRLGGMGVAIGSLVGNDLAELI